MKHRASGAASLLVTAAHRRVTLQHLIQVSRRAGLVLAGCLGVLAVVHVTLVTVDPAAVLLLAVAGVLVSAVVAWMSLPGRSRAAAMADRWLGTEDLFVTARYLESADGPGRPAEAAAARVRAAADEAAAARLHALPNLAGPRPGDWATGAVFLLGTLVLAGDRQPLFTVPIVEKVTTSAEPGTRLATLDSANLAEEIIPAALRAPADLSAAAAGVQTLAATRPLAKAGDVQQPSRTGETSGADEQRASILPPAAASAPPARGAGQHSEVGAGPGAPAEAATAERSVVAGASTRRVLTGGLATEAGAGITAGDGWHRSGALRAWAAQLEELGGRDG